MAAKSNDAMARFADRLLNKTGAPPPISEDKAAWEALLQRERSFRTLPEDLATRVAIVRRARLHAFQQAFPSLSREEAETIFRRVDALSREAGSVVRSGVASHEERARCLKQRCPGFPDDLYLEMVQRASAGSYW